MSNQYFFGGNVKAIGGGKVEGYLVYFTDENMRDLDGEYFDANTEFYLEDYPVKGISTMYHHGLDETVGVKVIGKVLDAKRDDSGLWIQAQLNMRDEYEKMVYELAESGKLGWSSGALPQGVRVEKGHIKAWPIIEASLTPTPAMPMATQIHTVKSLTALYNAREQAAGERNAGAVDANAEAGEFLNPVEDTGTIESIHSKGIVKMTREEIMALLEELGLLGKMDEEEAIAAAAEEVAKMDGEEEMTDEKYAEIAEKVASRLIKKHETRKSALRNAANAAKANAPAQPAPQTMPQGSDAHVADTLRNAAKGNVRVSEDLRFSHLTAEEMALGIELVAAQYKKSPSHRVPLRLLIDNGHLSEAYVRTAINKAADYARSTPYKNVNDNRALKMALPIKADEVNASDITGQGAEWAGDFWANELWSKERYPRVYDEFVRKGAMVMEVPQGFESVYIPTQGSDPTVYNTLQANDLSSGAPPIATQISAFGTGQQQVTPGELRAALFITDILAEDSVVNVVQYQSRVLTDTFLEYRDRLLINGDTTVTATGNINSDDADPDSGTGILDRPYYLTSNGLRKLPLVTASTRSRDAGGTLSLADYRATLAKLPGELRSRFNNLIFIIDPDTHNKSLSLPEIATDDVRRTFATISSGVLNNVYGVDVFMSGFLPLTEADGKASDTASNNTLGSILLAYAPYWAIVYKRQLTLASERFELSGGTAYVASMRIGIQYRSTDAASITYNVGVS